MSLSAESLKLLGFRCYDRLILDGLSRLVILVGPNAIGKTNIIEALQLLTSGESFRKPAWSETVSWGSDAARLELSLTDDRRVVDHVMLVKGNERVYEVNGKKKRVSSIRGTCPCVLFIPDDLQLVKASSARRRDAVDDLANQLSKNYATLKSEYQQSLRQRNLLLKEEMAVGPLFDSWNESLAINGARLHVNRTRLFSRLAEHMKAIYKKVVPHETLDVAYIPSWERFDEQSRQIGDLATFDEVPAYSQPDVEAAQESILEATMGLSAAERRRKTSLVGPHKDEIAFFIDGRNARLFASQGQQRTIVLVWKLAEVELMNEISGQKPLLLLDDVMSELDRAHRGSLTEFIEQSSQAFITTTNLEYFDDELLAQAQVIQLPLTDEQGEVAGI